MHTLRGAASQRLPNWPSVDWQCGQEALEDRVLMSYANINFQVSGAAPSGYIADTGATYASRNGFTYGWRANNSANTRNRNSTSSPDERHDTFAHMQKGGTYTWEIAVPNGRYNVHITAGESNYFNSVYKISAEGVLTVNGTPTTGSRWVGGTKTVTVSDGRLTISNASGSSNNKIDYIDISTVPTVPTGPGTPTGLSTTAISSSQIKLAWTDNATNETGYEIDRATNSTFTTGLTSFTAGVNANSFSSTGLSASTTYYYRVRATNSAASSANSNTANATTQVAGGNPEFVSSAASRIGGSGTDSVRGSAILSDGTVVLAANISNATPGGLTPKLLNGSTSTTSGAIIRLSSNGRTVLSVTRLAAEVRDLSTDSSDNLYVAAGDGGAFKLNSTATTVIWSKSHGSDRIDAAPNGDVAVLDQSLTSDGITPTGAGTVYTYNSAGTLYGSAAGYNKTYDVAIDDDVHSVFLTGFKQATGPSGNPVQIAYTKAQSYTGTQKWKGYDWSSAQVDDPRMGGTGPVNNMADTRGVRIDVGADENLYVAFMAAGGNHIFRYSPFNLFKKVSIVGGDKYHTFSNTVSEHKTFFGRYSKTTGDYVLGQQFLGRLTTGKGSTATLNQGGDIQADSQGRVYLTGKASTGLPLTSDPLPAGSYTGGQFLLVMSSNFQTRLLCTRFSTNGLSQTVAARIMGDGHVNIVYGGSASTSSVLWSSNAVQGSAGGGDDGFFGVFD